MTPAYATSCVSTLTAGRHSASDFTIVPQIRPPLLLVARNCCRGRQEEHHSWMCALMHPVHVHGPRDLAAFVSYLVSRVSCNVQSRAKILLLQAIGRDARAERKNRCFNHRAEQWYKPCSSYFEKRNGLCKYLIGNTVVCCDLGSCEWEIYNFSQNRCTLEIAYFLLCKQERFSTEDLLTISPGHCSAVSSTYPHDKSLWRISIVESQDSVNIAQNRTLIHEGRIIFWYFWIFQTSLGKSGLSIKKRWEKRGSVKAATLENLLGNWLLRYTSPLGEFLKRYFRMCVKSEKCLPQCVAYLLHLRRTCFAMCVCLLLTSYIYIYKVFLNSSSGVCNLYTNLM